MKVPFNMGFVDDFRPAHQSAGGYVGCFGKVINHSSKEQIHESRGFAEAYKKSCCSGK